MRLQRLKKLYLCSGQVFTVNGHLFLLYGI